MSITATITQIERLTEHVFALQIRPAEPLSYAPGQWLSLGLPVGPRPPTKRIYSMASPMRADGAIQLIFDHVAEGIGSTYLAGLKVGDTLDIINSMGNFVLPEVLPDQLLFIARYTGLVPIFSMLKQLESSAYPGRIHLIYSSPTERERFFVKELEALKLGEFSMDLVDLQSAQSPTPEADLAVDFGSKIEQEDLFTFICGVRDLVRPTRKQLLESGFVRKQIRAERFN